MKKIGLISDVHLEHSNSHAQRALLAHIGQQARWVELDVLVVAGDFARHDQIVEHLMVLQPHAECPVVYVPGNHEYWGSTIADVDAYLQQLDDDLNIHWLRPGRSAVTVAGINFVGSTLWFPQPSNTATRQYLENDCTNDFDCIENLKLIYGDMHERHKFALVQGMRHFEALKKPVHAVVTHYLPTFACVGLQWIGHRNNIGFVAQVDDFVTEFKPALWLHGHSHEHMDTIIEGTRFVRQPAGYPRERHNVQLKIIDIDADA